MGLASQFLRERLPQDMAVLLDSGDPTPGEKDRVDRSHRRELAGKVFRMSICGGELLPLFVLQQTTGDDPLTIAQVFFHCFAIIDDWYQEERRQEEEAQCAELEDT